MTKLHIILAKSTIDDVLSFRKHKILFKIIEIYCICVNLKFKIYNTLFFLLYI